MGTNSAAQNEVQYSAGIDKTTGCAVVFDTESGDILLIIPNGQTKIHRIGEECDACMRRDLSFAQRVAALLMPKTLGTTDHESFLAWLSNPEPYVASNVTPSASGIVRTACGWLINGQHFTADAEGWIPHINTHDSRCPAPAGVEFSVLYRTGEVFDNSSVLADRDCLWEWTYPNFDDPADIIAWRPTGHTASHEPPQSPV